MNIFLIGIGIIAYIATGGFLCGLIDNGDSLGVWVILWPVIAVGTGLRLVAELPCCLGEIVRRRFHKKNKTERIY